MVIPVILPRLRGIDIFNAFFWVDEFGFYNYVNASGQEFRCRFTGLPTWAKTLWRDYDKSLKREARTRVRSVYLRKIVDMPDDGWKSDPTAGCPPHVRRLQYLSTEQFGRAVARILKEA